MCGGEELEEEWAEIGRRTEELAKQAGKRLCWTASLQRQERARAKWHPSWMLATQIYSVFLSEASKIFKVQVLSQPVSYQEAASKLPIQANSARFIAGSCRRLEEKQIKTDRMRNSAVQVQRLNVLPGYHPNKGTCCRQAWSRSGSQPDHEG